METTAEEYESKYTLIRHIPRIIRITGQGFEDYSSYFTQPFDTNFMSAMLTSAQRIASEMLGFKLGFCFGEEATFLLTDYGEDSWLEGDVQNIASIAAAMMTVEFNSFVSGWVPSSMKAVFRARVFQIPSLEVIKYFTWRAQVCHADSVLRFAKSQMPSREIEGKTTQELIDRMKFIGRDWEHLPSSKRHGSFFWDESNEQASALTPHVAPTHQAIREIVRATLPVVLDV